MTHAVVSKFAHSIQQRVYVGSLQEHYPEDLPTSAGKSTWFAGEELTGAGENLMYFGL